MFKLTFLVAVLVAGVLTFVEADQGQKIPAKAIEKFKSDKETKLKQCCLEKLPKECADLCTYDRKSLNVKKLLNTLNPGYFIISHFLPGKCFVSDLNNLIPCYLEHTDVTRCCSDVKQNVNIINDMNLGFTVNQEQIFEDPGWCEEAVCTGKSAPFQIKTVLSCENTIKAAMGCYIKHITDEGKALADQIQDLIKNGISCISTDKEGIESFFKKFADILKSANKLGIDMTYENFEQFNTDQATTAAVKELGIKIDDYSEFLPLAVADKQVLEQITKFFNDAAAKP